MEVPLYDEDAGTDLESDSYYYPKSIEKQIVASKEIIEEHAPEKLIVFGGDCLVAQTPLDYLNGKYEKLGVLWFDAHPDISTPKQMNESHAMVLGNLIGGGADDLAKHVENPMDPAQFMYIGLVEETLSDFEREAVDKHQIPVINSQDIEDVQAASQKVQAWIAEQEFTHIAVFFDLDVLSPQEFRSIMPAEPYLEKFEAGIGTMKFNQLSEIINSLDQELVSLIMTEHMPWDAKSLQTFMGSLSIFK